MKLRECNASVFRFGAVRRAGVALRIHVANARPADDASSHGQFVDLPLLTQCFSGENRSPLPSTVGGMGCKPIFSRRKFIACMLFGLCFISQSSFALVFIALLISGNGSNPSCDLRIFIAAILFGWLSISHLSLTSAFGLTDFIFFYLDHPREEVSKRQSTP